jgi:hypothetical protein
LFDLQADVRVNDYQKDSIVDILGRNHQGVPNNWRTRPEDGGEEEGKGEVVEVVEMDDSGSSEEERCGLFCSIFFSFFPPLFPLFLPSFTNTLVLFIKFSLID